MDGCLELGPAAFLTADGSWTPGSHQWFFYLAGLPDAHEELSLPGLLEAVSYPPGDPLAPGVLISPFPGVHKPLWSP